MDKIKKNKRKQSVDVEEEKNCSPVKKKKQDKNDDTISNKISSKTEKKKKVKPNGKSNEKASDTKEVQKLLKKEKGKKLDDKKEGNKGDINSSQTLQNEQEFHPDTGETDTHNLQNNKKAKEDIAEGKKFKKKKKKKNMVDGSDNNPSNTDKKQNTENTKENVEDGKKGKKKKRLGKKKQIDNDEDTVTNVAKNAALEYLKMWDTNRVNWKFQKVRQVWLLQHLYDQEKVSSDIFPTLLQYLVDLKGRAREETLSKAQSIVDEDDEENVLKYDRARDIIQMLA